MDEIKGRIIDNRDKTDPRHRYIALEFSGGLATSKKIRNLLRNKFQAKSYFRNFPRIILSLFVDDYSARYIIQGKAFDIQNLVSPEWMVLLWSPIRKMPICFFKL